MSVKALRGMVVTLPRVDKTLSKEGYTADAKAMGEEFAKLNKRFDNIDPHFAENVEYSPEESGITAETVQAALDWIVANYLRITGGKISGNLEIERSSPAMKLINTANSRVGMTHYSNSSNLILSNNKDDNNMVGIWIKPETENPKDYLDLGTYINGEFTRYPIFGTYNKPTGKYTGTNSSASVAITIGGVGTTLKISTTKGMAIVTGAGAICKKYSDTEVYGLAASACKFEDGVLTLATNDEVVNAARDYYYEVL